MRFLIAACGGIFFHKLSLSDAFVTESKFSSFGKNSISKAQRKDTVLFASSAFGKAAIGRKKEDYNGSLTKNSIDVSPSTLRRKGNKPVVLRTAMSTEEVMRRRNKALHALENIAKLPSPEAIEILNRHPRLYTHLPPSSGDLTSKLQYLLNDVNLKPSALRKMLNSHPRLMETVLLDNEDNLSNTMDILQQELDLTSSQVFNIQKHFLPAILSYNRSELRKRIQVYKHDLGLSTKEVKKMVTKDPRMLRTNADNVKRLIEIFDHELGIDKADLRQLLQKESLLLTYNAEDNIMPTILFLKQGLVGTCLGLVERKGVSTVTVKTNKELAENGMTSEDVIVSRLKTLIMGHPKILSSSLECNLKPTVDFFFDEIGLKELEFGKVMYRRGGSLLEANVDRTLVRKVNFLRSQLGLELSIDENTDKAEMEDVKILLPSQDNVDNLTASDKKRLLAQIIATTPDILTLSIENNMEPKFEYFRETLGFSQEQLRYIMVKRPQILSLNLERNIKPKIEFLCRDRSVTKHNENVESYIGGLGLTVEEIRSWVVRHPQTLTFSLKSIKCRSIDVVKNNLQIGDEPSMVPFNFIARSEKSWARWLKNYYVEP